MNPKTIVNQTLHALAGLSTEALSLRADITKAEKAISVLSSKHVTIMASINNLKLCLEATLDASK